MSRMAHFAAAFFVLMSVGSTLMAEPTATIDTTKPTGKISSLHHGLMTEEINHCYDGGLYAELVRNRTFMDDAKTPAHWSATGNAKIALDTANPLNTHLTTSLRVEVNSGTGAVANDGFWGIPVTPDTKYRASFFAKAAAGFDGAVTVSIQSEDGKTIYASAKVSGISAEWKQFEGLLETGKVEPTIKARYVLSVDQPGTVWLNLVSLFPPTWKDRPNGLRKDLMQMLVDLKPGFLRFPGGNYLEGETIETRFKWKETLGPLTERPGHMGTWSYRSSDGMGMMEFLLWCDDMGAEPVLGLYAGYSLKGAFVKPGPDLEPFIQEALEEIEYVTGDTSTNWGARRAKDGHPEPFKLRYVEVGNEDWFDKSGSYDGRFAQFYDAIKAKYPQLKVISTVGLEHPEKLRVHSRKPDVVDEHYYRSTDEFLKDSATHYEKYAPNGPEIFVGEWAAHEDAKVRPWSPDAKKQPPTPNMWAAIGDAAWMLAMERNPQHIVMQCYAPLLVNVNPGAYQWRPNLIGYNALSAFGSPSYHAIKMFSQNMGDEALATSLNDTAVQASATRDSNSGQIILKLVNPQAKEASISLELKGVGTLSPTATATTLTGELTVGNSLEDPTKIAPVTSTVEGVKPSFTYTVPAHAIVVLKFSPR